MPYKSKAQAAYFHANRAKLERQGVDVDEWDAASKGKSIPARVRPMNVRQAAREVTRRRGK